MLQIDMAYIRTRLIIDAGRGSTEARTPIIEDGREWNNHMSGVLWFTVPFTQRADIGGEV